MSAVETPGEKALLDALDFKPTVPCEARWFEKTTGTYERCGYLADFTAKCPRCGHETLCCQKHVDAFELTPMVVTTCPGCLRRVATFALTIASLSSP